MYKIYEIFIEETLRTRIKVALGQDLEVEIKTGLDLCDAKIAEKSAGNK